MTFLFSLLIFLPKILCGFALIHWFWDEVDVPSVVLKSGLAIPVGLALSSSLFFVAMLIGIPPQTYSLVEFWVFLAAAILILLFFLFKTGTNWKFTKLTWQGYLLLFIPLVGLGLMSYAFLFYSRMHPYGFEDTWSIWNFLARFLYRMNSPAILFNHPYYEPFHPDYPPGLGLNVAWGWFVLQRESTSLPIAIAFYILVSPALLLWGALQKWRGFLPAILATLLYTMIPNLKWSVGQMADGFISLYMLSAIIMLYGYLRSSQPGFLFLAGLAAGYSAWIKNEGLLFVCVFLVIVILMVWKQNVERSAKKWIAGGLAAPLLITAAYKVVIGTPSDLFSGDQSITAQLIDIQRWWIIARDFSTNILRYGNWPVSVVFVLVVYALLMGFDRKESSRQIWLLLIILGQFAGYFVIYLITPHDLAWHISTSMDRLVSHLFPMIIFWLFVALRPPQYAPVQESMPQESSA